LLLQVQKVKARTEAPLARQIVSGVNGSVSVLCLALTFLTYSLFTSLRSLPGLNNMGLSVSLGLAQLSLCFHGTRLASSPCVAWWAC
jgi:hypothetical protein